LDRHTHHMLRPALNQRRAIWFISLVAILLVMGIGVTSTVAETAPGKNAVPPTPKVLRFAMVHALGGVNSEDARIAIDVYWSRHLERVFPGLDSQFEIIPNSDAAAQRIKSGRLHGLSLGVAQYLQLQDIARLRPVFISSRLARPLESNLLLVRKGVNWQTLSTQGAKHLVTEKMTEPDIGRMWLETVLNDRGLPQAQSFFKEISQGAKPARVILPVFFEQADVCLVSESAYATMVELNPQINRRLTVLERSPGFVKTIHCATSQLPDFMADRFIQRGVRMEDGVDGRQLLLIFHVKKNFVYESKYMENSERIYRKYQEITK